VSDRKDSFTGQLVTQQFYDTCFDQLETADRAMTSDSGFTGIYNGLGVAEHAGTPDMTVDVDTGVAYAPGGERMRAATPNRIDCSVDRDSISTTVTNPGESRILAIIMRPDRILSDPQLDASQVTVFTQRTESYVIEVVQGAAAVSPSAPAIPAGSTLLADITIIFGQTTILDADIEVTGAAARRQDAFFISGTPYSTRVGTAKQAIQDQATRYNQHVNGAADQHDGGDLVYGGSGLWADGTTNVSAPTIGGAITEIVSDLASTTANDPGENRIGCDADGSIGIDILSASTLRARLRLIRLASHLYYAGSNGWADATTLPASTVEAAIDSVVSTIAASTGAQKMGMATINNIAGGTVQAAFAQLTNTASSDDGAKRIGTQSVAGSPDSLAGSNARVQLSELLSLTNARARKGSAETITGAWIFNDITASGTSRYKYAARALPRTQTGFLRNDAATDPISHVAQSLAPTELGFQMLDRLPDNSELVSVTLWFDRNNTGVMPTTRIKGTLYKKDVTTSAVETEIVAETEDPENVLANYEAHHGLTLTPGSTEIIDNEKYVYWVRIRGESGSNTAAGTWYCSTAICDISEQDEAP
jgi:hypothetical protein